MDEAEVIEQFKNLARGKVNPLIDLLPPFDETVTLPGTSTRVRTHFIAHDANGFPAVDRLAKDMADAAMDFCIPRAKTERAWAEYEETKSSSALMSLSEQARGLFVKSEKSGEGGELLLFLLLERILKLPQLLSKMSLKTNTQVHVHGSDGVHAALGEDGILDIYWGESKLYADSAAAFKDCLESIAPYLRGDGGNRRKQDLMLLRDHLNVSQIEVAAHLLEYFDETSAKVLKVRWNGACLVGFDHEEYPNILTISQEQRLALAENVKKWHEKMTRQVKKFEIVGINIDLFCIPMPNVADLRGRVLSALGAN